MSKRKIVHYSNKKIEIDIEISKEYIKLKKQLMKINKQLEPIETQLKEELREAMRKLEQSSLISNGIEVKLNKDTIRNNFDTDKFKKDNMNLYNEYLKPTPVKGSLSINIERGV